MDISVTLRDAADGGVIARTAVPSSQLPPAFDGTQLLEAAGRTWRVVRAEPAFREEYELVGTLELTLREVERVAPVPATDIRFSMSSICDRLPAIVGPMDGRSVLLVKDDLWRDVELVSAALGADVDSTFEEIRRIQTDFRSGPGFTELHVRALPAEPMAGTSVTLEHMAEAFGATTHFLRPVAIEGQGIVADGFALSVADGVSVYGLADDGRVTVAGVHRTGISDASLAAVFAEWLAGRGLELVDWRAGLRTDEEGTLVEWFSAPPQPLWR